jgi:hypothetical protein
MSTQRRPRRVVPESSSDSEEIPQKRRFPGRKPMPLDVRDRQLEIGKVGISKQRGLIRRTPFFPAKMQAPLESGDRPKIRQMRRKTKKTPRLNRPQYIDDTPSFRLDDDIQSRSETEEGPDPGYMI